MRIILIDDEPLALEFLVRQINKINHVEVVEKFTYFDLKRYKSLLKEIDLVFLDIEMPGVNGLELAEKIIEVNPSLSIVFVTGYNEYAVQAFELNALDYLLKPVQLDRLQKTLERARSNINQMERPLSGESTLQINVCGELTFKQANGSSKIVKWRTTKAQELFLYLLHHAGKTVRKSILAELLWPDFEQDKAYSQLYTAIYHIRKTLAKYKEYFSIKNIQEGYALIMKNSKIDIVEWENQIKKLPIIDLEVIESYENVMEIYTNAYLEEYDYLWAEAERFRLEQLWLRVASEIADCYAQNGDIEQASAWYVQICNLKPDDVSACFSLMKIYAKLGYGLLVKHQYDQLENSLEDLDIGMDEEVEQWYEEWRITT